jgi:hypothetical protein
MGRTTAWAAAGVLGLALSIPAGAVPDLATATPTCRGEAATIVGNGGRIVGTEGRDVVITNRSKVVDTLGGDDLVCVTGPDEPGRSYHPVSLSAGFGNDVVDGTAARSWPVEGELGPGADVFYGGAGMDSMMGGSWDAAGYSHQDFEVDVLLPGGGDDRISSGTEGLANSDVVDLGAGGDYLRWSGVWTAGASITGGPGGDGFSRYFTSGNNLLDFSSGVAAVGDSTEMRFSSLEWVTLFASHGADVSLRVVGSDASEAVYLWDGPARTVTADLGGGNDVLSVMVAPAGGTVAGGAGRDRLEMGSDDGFEFDMTAGILSAGGVTVPATGWEDAFLLAPEVDVVGTAADNDLRSVACHSTLRGRGGDDGLAPGTDDDHWDHYFFSCRKPLTLRGGPGDDDLAGSFSADLLAGGPGRDSFSGGGGRDTILGGPGNDVADGSGPYDCGIDCFGGGYGNDMIIGGPGADLLDGDGGDDVVRGGAGHDHLIGGGGADVLSGGPAGDVADGGRGRDACTAERKRSCER